MKREKRKIKFRAYDKADVPIYRDGRSRMSYYGPNFEMDDDQNFLAFYTLEGESGPLGDRDSMERFVLMQYVGLKDKKGKEIYEGDILKWTHPDFADRKVEYKILEMSDIRKSLMLEPDCANGWIEVIGNVHETPELITP